MWVWVGVKKTDQMGFSLAVGGYDSTWCFPGNANKLEQMIPNDSRFFLMVLSFRDYETLVSLLPTYYFIM